MANDSQRIYAFDERDFSGIAEEMTFQEVNKDKCCDIYMIIIVVVTVVHCYSQCKCSKLSLSYFSILLQCAIPLSFCFLC